MRNASIEKVDGTWHIAVDFDEEFVKEQFGTGLIDEFGMGAVDEAVKSWFFLRIDLTQSPCAVEDLQDHIDETRDYEERVRETMEQFGVDDAEARQLIEDGRGAPHPVYRG